VKPAPFDYVAPTSVDDACALLSEAGGGATIIAGGQTLMPLLNLRMSQPFIVVDINRIAALQGIARSSDGIRIGPMTRQCELIDSELLARELPVLVQAARHVGHHQTRNRGTIGGSIALGEPAAELPATAVALGATIEVRSVRGTRQIPASEFYLGPYMTALESDELVTAITFPGWSSGHLTLFHELAQRPGDFALVGMVGALEVDDSRIGRAGIGWFGMGPTPIRARRAEQALQGQSLDAIDVDAIAELAVSDTAPFDDQRASADYRRTVGRRLFARTLREACSANSNLHASRGTA
jgi:carbon-monoxide dehydrogenase medium subunit